MRRILLIVIFSVFAYGAAYAQLPVSGKIYELGTRVVLPGVKVQNTNTKDNTQSNAAGFFSIKAKAGDILIFESFAYKSDTVLVTNTRYLEIFLQPQNTNLKEVKIKDQATRLGTLKDTTFHNQTVRYQRDENGNLKGGIAIKFGYGKSAKEKREEKLAFDTVAIAQIDKAFEPVNISKYIPLKGNSLKQFIAIYRPTIKQYKAPNFDLTLYLNDCYKKFLALPPDKRKLASLKADTVSH